MDTIYIKNIEIVNKHMKRCSISIAIRETLIITTTSSLSLYTPIEMDKIKVAAMPIVGELLGKQGHSPTLERDGAVLKKINCVTSKPRRTIGPLEKGVNYWHMQKSA